MFNSIIFAQTIRIQNNSRTPFQEKVIEISWEMLKKNYPVIDSSNFKVINILTNKEIDYQLEYKGQSRIQNLLVQISINADSKLDLKLIKGKHKLFVTKTYCRFVPERKDDFAWENDKIAFRAYGKALENTKENAYGFDVWVKKNSSLVINHRYKTNDYHVDHGNGLDYYHVGLSLGAGNMAPYINDTISYPHNYDNYVVFDNGPLRSTFKLYFKNFMVGGKTISSTKTISLDAGDQLNKIQATYMSSADSTMNLVAGIIKREKPGVIYMNENNGILAYWEPQHNNDGITGVATLMNSVPKKMWITQQHFLTLTQTIDHKITYYAGAAWNKAGRIKSAQQWIKYLEDFKNQLAIPLTVSFKN